MKGAVPFVLFGLVAGGDVEVEAADGEGVRRVAGGELGERVGALEGEGVGGGDDVAHFVVHLSTGAEEMDGERDGFHFRWYGSHGESWTAVTAEVCPDLPGCLHGA